MRLLLLLLLACSVEARVERADAALRAGDLEAAESRYRAIVDEHPDQVDALYGLGWLYHQAGEADRAREYFKRCQRVAPEDYRGHRGLGSVALSEGNTATAVSHFEDALRYAPDEPRVHNSLGLARLVAGDLELALTHFEKAHALAKDDGEYGYNLADVLYRLKRYDEALATIDEALGGRIAEKRFRGLLLELRALVLTYMTAGRIDPERCAETAGPVLAWLDEANANLAEAEGLGVELPNLPTAKRRVYRRRSVVSEQCPTAADD